jgi:hypothetical protein
VIAMLQQEFVCCWLLAKDLEAVAARAGDPEIGELCRKIRANYGYPVDSVLLSADLEVVGHLNVEEPAAPDPDGYLAFLRRGLAKAGLAAAAPEPEAGSAATTATNPAVRAAVATLAATHQAADRHAPETPPVVLTRETPSASVLDVIRKGGFGEISFRFLSIDTAAFDRGGTIEVEVRVGGNAADGRFELCSSTPDAPNSMSPIRTLDVAPGETRRVEFRFAPGTRLGLAIKPGARANAGDMNAFLVKLSVLEPWPVSARLPRRRRGERRGLTPPRSPPL